MPKQEMFLIWYSYSELEKGSISFKRYFSRTNLQKECKTHHRYYSFKQDNYVGNMHADTSHLDYEVHELYSRKDFEDWANEAGMEIDWKKRILKED